MKTRRTQPGGAGTPYTWVDWTGTYTSGASGGAIGQTLKIYLSAGGIQTDYDELSLNASPDSPGGVPEPAVFALVGAGLLGLVTRRRFAPWRQLLPRGPGRLGHRRR